MKLFPRLIYKINKLYINIAKPTTVGVKLLLVWDQTVMMVKHTYQPYWYLPGGGVKKGETLMDAARREAAEELDAELGKLNLFGLYTNINGKNTDHIVVFSCDTFTFTGKTDWEIERFDLFPIDKLPPDVSPGSKQRINEFADRDDPPIVGTW